MDGYRIRQAIEEDCEELARLIKELGEYEKLPEKVKTTPEDLRRDGFGEEKFFRCLVVEDTTSLDEDKKPDLVGHAMYHFAYSAWEGRVIYLEDLYLAEGHRGRGVGTRLLKDIAKIGLANGCKRMSWVVMNWDTSAIEFYKSKGAFDVTAGEKWHIYRMEKPEVERLAAS